MKSKKIILFFVLSVTCFGYPLEFVIAQREFQVDTTTGNFVIRFTEVPLNVDFEIIFDHKAYSPFSFFYYSYEGYESDTWKITRKNLPQIWEYETVNLTILRNEMEVFSKIYSISDLDEALQVYQRQKLEKFTLYSLLVIVGIIMMQSIRNTMRSYKETHYTRREMKTRNRVYQHRKKIHLHQEERHREDRINARYHTFIQDSKTFYTQICKNTLNPIKPPQVYHFPGHLMIFIPVQTQYSAHCFYCLIHEQFEIYHQDASNQSHQLMMKR
jgi:hypothetical protein